MDRDRLGDLRPQVEGGTVVPKDLDRVLFAEGWGDLAEYLIWKGHVEPVRTHELGLLLRCWKWVQDHPDAELPKPSAVHVGHLVQEARRQEAQHHEEIALVLAVTAVEHVMNDVLWRGIVDAGYGPEEIEERLWWNFPSKTRRLWKQVFGDRMETTMRTKILAAVDQRNAFVHLKAPGDVVALGEDFVVSVGVADELLDDTHWAIDRL